jgi:preprotein translocase subunit SecF
MIGFLTILGYSMYDTVVVFDKVRENTSDVFNQTRNTYEELSNLAVNQTLVRSINTSIVALLPVGSILIVGTVFMGPGTLRDIALALFVGMLVGMYSSIFLATPLNVTFRSKEKKVIEHTNKIMADREKRIEELGEDAEGIGDIYTPNIQLLPGKRLSNKAQPRRVDKPKK